MNKFRAIKFRGISESKKKVVYGNCIICDEKAHQVFLREVRRGYDVTDWEEIQNGTLCQSTGLQDKNGTDIYEGDVIRLEDVGVFMVSWNDERCCFELRNKNGEFVDKLWKLYEEWYLIIGNVLGLTQKDILL